MYAQDFLKSSSYDLKILKFKQKLLKKGLIQEPKYKSTSEQERKTPRERKIRALKAQRGIKKPKDKEETQRSKEIKTASVGTFSTSSKEEPQKREGKSLQERKLEALERQQKNLTKPVYIKKKYR